MLMCVINLLNNSYKDHYLISELVINYLAVIHFYPIRFLKQFFVVHLAAALPMPKALESS